MAALATNMLTYNMLLSVFFPLGELLVLFIRSHYLDHHNTQHTATDVSSVCHEASVWT